jgi:hypothetical protein
MAAMGSALGRVAAKLGDNAMQGVEFLLRRLASLKKLQ